jgi:hypothetical protein
LVGGCSHAATEEEEEEEEEEVEEEEEEEEEEEGRQDAAVNSLGKGKKLLLSASLCRAINS